MKTDHPKSVFETKWFRIMRVAWNDRDYFYAAPTADSVMIICEDNENRFLLEEQTRPTIGKSFDFPAGSVEVGDKSDLRAAALRELREETGRVPICIEYIGVLKKDPGFSSGQIHLFSARIDGTASVGTDDEVQALHRLTELEVTNAIRSGKISCALCTAAWYRFLIQRG